MPAEPPIEPDILGSDVPEIVALRALKLVICSWRCRRSAGCGVPPRVSPRSRRPAVACADRRADRRCRCAAADPRPRPSAAAAAGARRHRREPAREWPGEPGHHRPARCPSHGRASFPGHDGPPWRDGILERERWVRLVEAHGMPADENDVGLLTPETPAVLPHSTVVHVGAFYGSRRWPLDRFARVAAALCAQGADVVLSGSEAERPGHWRSRDGPDCRRPPSSPVVWNWASSRHWSPRPTWSSPPTPGPHTLPPRTGSPRWCCSGRHPRRNGGRRHPLRRTHRGNRRSQIVAEARSRPPAEELLGHPGVRAADARGRRRKCRRFASGGRRC